MRVKYNLPCNIAQTLNVLGDRWTLLILHEMLQGRTLYSEIKKALPGISSNLLSDRLSSLKEQGLIDAVPYLEEPPRYHYKLTKGGEDLEDVFNALIIWGSTHLKEKYKKLVDPVTGNGVDIGYYSKQTGQQVFEIEVTPVSDD